MRAANFAGSEDKSRFFSSEASVLRFSSWSSGRVRQRRVWLRHREKHTVTQNDNFRFGGFLVRALGDYRQDNLWNPVARDTPHRPCGRGYATLGLRLSRRREALLLRNILCVAKFKCDKLTQYLSAAAVLPAPTADAQLPGVVRRVLQGPGGVHLGPLQEGLQARASGALLRRYP